VSSEPIRITEPLKFGENFELDVRAYELRRSGLAIKLERIPMELLVLLVEMRGQLVTRNQIIERIWGKDVFFDSDNSINSAVRKIRNALKDDPDRPRFVVTVTGKGYRFVAPVQEASLPAPSLVNQNAAGSDTLLGRKISHYRVLEMLGGGGMGIVYKAEDLKLGRLVAMKFLPSEVANDPGAFERLQREARAASALDHPNICAIYELGDHEGQPFIVMQLLEGRTLREWISAAPEPSPKARLHQVVDLATQIADGLEAAHQKGILHRDIKPANIFITTRGQAKILDFGIAKFLNDVEIGDANPESNLKSVSADANNAYQTRTGVLLGTPSYLSPEQIRREKLDARTDLFSFGLVLYEMATAQRAFSGDTVSIIREAVLNLPPVPARQVCPDIPVALEKIISKSLEKDRELRYQSAKDIRVDLTALSVVPVEVQERRPRTALWIAAGLVLFILALLIYDMSVVRRKSIDHAASVKTRPSVAVLGFRNLSGKQDQAWISTALSEMLSSDLSAGQQMRVIPGEDVERMKLDLNLPVADNYSRETLRLIHNHLGSDVVVLGSYLAIGKDSGGKVRIDLQLQDAREGETIGVIQSDGTEAGLAEMVAQGGAALRQKLGLTTVSGDDARQISASVPSNPDAARLYAEGLAKLEDSDALAARDLLEKAIGFDPKHALSHGSLAQAWSTLGYEAKAASEAKIAFELSTDLPREQRLSIEGRSHEYARDLPGAIEIYKTLRNFFPDNLDYALRLATAQTKGGFGKDALQTISRTRQLPKPDSDDARIDLAEAHATESLGDFSAAQRIAAVAARKAQEHGRRLLVAQAKELEAWTWERLGDLDKATQEMHEARDLADALQNQGLLGLTLKQIGVIDEDKGEYEKARASHQSALAIFQKIGYQRQVARTLEALGNIDFEQERLAGAKHYYEEALRVDREIAASAGNIGSDLGSIANVLDSSGDLVGATEMQEQSLKGFRDAGDKRGESDDLLNLGNVLVERGELAAAQHSYEQGLSVAREIGYKHGEGSLLNSMVDVLLAQDRLSDARATAQRAIAIRQASQEQTEVARAQIQLAMVALEEGKAGEAEQLARQAAPVFERQKMDGDASVCAAVLAGALLTEGKLDDANAASDKALAFAHRTVYRPSNFAASLAAAHVKIREGKVAEGTIALEAVRADAARYGYREFEFQARLQLGELMLRSGKAANGRTDLERLESDAMSSGFVRIAHQAQAALAS
jgi:serine/threonine protein kinase/DNA-binding winged helix-turn-helix (wHTH) protein